MPTYEVMREVARDPATDTFVPALVWVRGPEGITVASYPDHNALEHRYRSSITGARQRGMSDREIWDYFAAEGGNGYQTLRSQPTRVSADDLRAATEAALRTFRQAGPP